PTEHESQALPVLLRQRRCNAATLRYRFSAQSSNHPLRHRARLQVPYSSQWHTCRLDPAPGWVVTTDHWNCSVGLRRHFHLWRGFGKSRRSCHRAELRQRALIAMLLVRLLLMDVGNDVVNWAVGRAWRRRGLRICGCAYDNNGDRPTTLHTAI